MGSLLVCMIGLQPQTSQAQVKKESMIEIKLEVSPSEFDFADIEDVKITFGATNKGKETLPPKLDQCQLYINGEFSYAWSLTMGNGLRPYDWYDLPGNESVSLTWSTLAKSLITEPGTYQLRLELEDETIQEMVVVCHGKQ